MKWTRSVLVLSSLVVMSPYLTVPAHAQQCSAAGVAGGYGFTITGTLLTPTPVPLAAVGKASFNANGGFSGTEARSVGGGFANETLTGTFTVNPDCTGTLTAEAFENGELVRKSVFSIVFDNDEKEVRAVQESLQLFPGGTFVPAVITVEGKKTFSGDQQN